MKLASFLWLASTLAAGQGTRLDLDADRMRTGLFRYRTLVEGKEAGRSQIGIRKLADSDNFVYTNVVEGAFSQSWEAVASREFRPISAKLTMGKGIAAHTAFELAYLGSRVTGFASSRSGQTPAERRPVDESVAADTVDQRIDWAAVMSLNEYVPGGRFEFHVYDPGTGNSRVIAQIGGLETLTVPAGSFDTVRVTYRIEKNRGTEAYEVFLKKEVPRVLVKERFPNGAVTELLEVKP